MPSDTAVSLFSQTGIRQGLPSRIKDLLDVPVAPKDCLPEHICRKCKRKLERLERAAEELEDFRKEASSTYSTLALRQKELTGTCTLLELSNRGPSPGCLFGSCCYMRMRALYTCHLESYTLSSCYCTTTLWQTNRMIDWICSNILRRDTTIGISGIATHLMATIPTM